MRTRGILLVRDTTPLLDILPTNGERHPSSLLVSSVDNEHIDVGIKLELWRQSCNRVVASLKEFSQGLFDGIGRFRLRGDEVGAEVIGSSCIICLAHLAVLCEVICRVDPIAGTKTFELCDWALRGVGMLTSELHFAEYTHLDLLLGVRLFLYSLPTTMAQAAGWGRTPGRNHCRSSASA
jgi:hypothetical protein